MDKTLSDYDQSLEELERQREHLELVMKKMGQEWEESGAGIGWMALQQSSGNSESDNGIPNEQEDNQVHESDPLELSMTTHESPSPPLQQEQQKDLSTYDTLEQHTSTHELRDSYPPTPISPELQQQNIRTSLDESLHVIIDRKDPPSSMKETSLNLLMTPSSNGPSADYLQSLLNVNEALLAQSLTSSSSSSSSLSSTTTTTTTTITQPTLSSLSTTTLQEQPSHLSIQHRHRRYPSQTKEELHFVNGFPIEDVATASILSPPITPEESYSTARASCLSRKNSLAKSAVRPSTSFQQPH